MYAQRARARSRFSVASGRLGRPVWDVYRDQVFRQGMDQLVAWLVLFGRWRRERMEGTVMELRLWHLLHFADPLLSSPPYHWLSL